MTTLALSPTVHEFKKTPLTLYVRCTGRDQFLSHVREAKIPHDVAERRWAVARTLRLFRGASVYIGSVHSRNEQEFNQRLVCAVRGGWFSSNRLHVAPLNTPWNVERCVMNDAFVLRSDDPTVFTIIWTGVVEYK